MKIKKTAALSFVFIILAVLYIPIIILIIYSFTDTTSIGTWNGFSFDLYIKMIQDEEILSAVSNTMIIALISSAIATVLGTFSAIGIYYLKKVPKAVANTMNQIVIVNVDIVTGIAFMMFFVTLKIKSGYFTLIVAHTIIALPYVILSVLPRLGQLNPNLYEAGLDCGASPMKTMIKVILPQLIPAMISGFALAFTLSLDDFIVTKYNNGTVTTISTYLYTKLVKKGIPNVLRALSTTIFVVSVLILIAVNINSAKKRKKELKMLGR